MIQNVRGTQDFIDLTLFNYIVDQARAHLETHNFTQIATPIIEHTALFKRTLGEYTDVVTKEMYTLNTGPDGEDLCLRPEATAATVRAFIQAGINQLPWKVFSWGPMFRHERPQKGRYRQFHQVNIELIGAASIAYDAYCIALLNALFGDRLGLRTYVLQINFIGCAQDRTQFTQTLTQFLQQQTAQLCATCHERTTRNPLRVFDCKNEACQTIYSNAPQITAALCSSCSDEWHTLQQLLQTLAVAYTHNPKLVRGLDYYNKTVFEFTSSALGAQSAFCAGGRYDGLVEQISGNTSQPAVGAGIGIERVMLLLEEQQAAITQACQKPLHVIIPFGAAHIQQALVLEKKLTDTGLRTECILDLGSPKSMFRRANRLNAAYCLIIGDDEAATASVTIKDMNTSSETRTLQSEVLAVLTK